MILRNYQKECLDIILRKDPGKYLIQLATGLGKTIIFTKLSDYISGKMLILSHKIELVYQPLKYLNCSYAVEHLTHKSNYNEKVISTTVQTFIKRYKKFDPDYFEMIVIDECHHSSAKIFKEIIDYFKPKKLLGFSATPNRADNIRLDNIFDEIIFERSIQWGILNKYLCGIKCKSVNIGFDISGVKSNSGDFNEKKLDAAVNIDKANKAIAEIYNKYSIGQTLIFCVSINHCRELKKLIPDAKIIDGGTSKNERKIIMKDFNSKKLRCIINCMVFIEGIDAPCINTIIMARPTKSQALYIQAVGRGLRPYKDKDKLLLIDCVGASKNNLCMAPTLFGLDIENSSIKPDEIDNDIFDLAGLMKREINNPESWIKNIRNVQVFKKKFGYDTHNVNYFLNPNGSFILSLPGLKKIIPAPDKLGYIKTKKGKIKLQDAFDIMYNYLVQNKYDDIQLWDLTRMKRWGKGKITNKQKFVLKDDYSKHFINSLNKMEASILINKQKGNY